MARKRSRIPREKRKFLLRDSDRSGFKHFRKDLIKQGGLQARSPRYGGAGGILIHPDERDESPPSSESLGGEGDGNAVDLRADRNNTKYQLGWDDSYYDPSVRKWGDPA